MDTETAGRTAQSPGSDPASTVTALYRAHAVALIRLAVIMLGDRAAAEDVVQDAFIGLFRHWHRLADPAAALTYVRSSVLNGCRLALRSQARRDRRDRAAAAGGQPTAESAESLVLLSEEHQEVIAAVRRLPRRQREALVLRFYFGLSEEETARAMGVSRGTVKSAMSRARAALGKTIREENRDERG